GKQLVGYVVLASEPNGWQGELATHLAAQLPDYMVPAQWVALAAMPLSPNGKLERRALPRPEAASQVAYQAPVTELEQALARIWAGALDVAQVGLGDDFFALGGHSLLATQVVMQVREHCAVEVPLKLLFTHSSLRGFCAEVALLTQAVQPLQDELAKSLEALKRLTADDLEKLLS
uniref:phosphopantetheine-binding protein n=1 Tax=Pseudomonas sp. RIT-PI-S TaxID=3035295 RepID=UPI0021D9F4B2